MPYEAKQITLQATQGWIMAQGEPGNTPVGNDFRTGLVVHRDAGGTYQGMTQQPVIIQFEDFPEDAQGWSASIYSEPVTLNIYSLDQNVHFGTWAYGEYAPFYSKSYDQLNLPDDPEGYPEGYGIFLFSDSVRDPTPRWISDSVKNQFLSVEEFKKLADGMLLWSHMEIYDNRYFGENYISFTQKPYIVLSLHNTEVHTTNLNPDGGYQNPDNDITLSWGYQYNGGAEEFIVGNKPQISDVTVTVVNKANNKSKQYAVAEPYTSVVIPSADFASNGSLGPGTYNWNVEFSVSSGGYNDRHITATFTTLGEIPVAVINGPIDEIIDGEIANTFSWQYLSGSGLAQAKWEIEISGNGTQWTDQASGESAATSYTAPANSLPTGRVYWRVRVTDTAGNVSEWSDPAQIVVQAQVATPTITLVLNQARPVVQWQSSGQISYELDILQNGEIIYSTGEVPGSATAHQVTDYLSPGSYMARLRIRDSALEQSGWGMSSFTLSFSTTLTPSLTAESVEGGVQLTPSGLGTTNYLLRDGVPIAKISGAYIDYGASAGAHLYVLRAVDAADNFTDSAAVTGTTKIPRGARLAPVSDLSQQLELWLRRGENPTRSMTSQATTTAHHAAGREFPVVDYYEFSDNELSLAFSFRETANWEALRALLGKRQTMLYRDSHGEKCYLVVPSSGWERGRFSVDFDLSAVQVDYVEAISYDPPGGTV